MGFWNYRFQIKLATQLNYFTFPSKGVYNHFLAYTFEVDKVFFRE